MRVTLAEYTDVLDFEVKGLEPPSGETTITWELPTLTRKQKAKIRDKINVRFGTQWSSLIKKKVLKWSIKKRKECYFSISCDCHHNALEFDGEEDNWDEEKDAADVDKENDNDDWDKDNNDEDDETDDEDSDEEIDDDESDEETDEDGSDEEAEADYEHKENVCNVSFYCRQGIIWKAGMSTGGHIPLPVKRKRADVEFLVQFGDSFIFFNDLEHTSSGRYKYDNYTFRQDKKPIPVEVCNQLKNLGKDQVTIKVFGVFRDKNVKQRLRLGLNRVPLTLPEFNWKIFLDQQRTDVTVVAHGGELIDCHWSYITRNSRMLSEMLVPPTRKSFVVDMQDLTRIQVEAFLRYQYSGTIDKILETPDTSLGALKAADRFKIQELWTDTMEGLLKMDSKWFEEVALELTNFLINCSKREEEATQKLIDKSIGKISEELRRESQAACSNSVTGDSGGTRNEEENDQGEENRETGDNDEGSGHRKLVTMDERLGKDLGKILESKLYLLSFLRVSESYKYDGMWNDMITALLEKDSDWFGRDLALELKTFLDGCSKRDEEATQRLIKTLSQLLEQSRSIGLAEATQVREHEGPNGGIVNTVNSPLRRAKRRRVTEEDPDQLMGNINSCVENLPGPVIVDPNLRRSTRLQAGKRKSKTLQTEEEPRKKANRKAVQKRKRGLQTVDLSWKRALQHAAENERNASKSGEAGRGPRDIWKDPLLPKVSIFPDPEVKVEKVEPPEEENEDSAGMDAVELQQFVQDCVAVTVKEEEPAPMDDSSANVEDSAGCGVIISSWSLRETTENI